MDVLEGGRKRCLLRMCGGVKQDPRVARLGVASLRPRTVAASAGARHLQRLSVFTTRLSAENQCPG